VTIQPKRRQWEEADHKLPASPQQQRFYPWRQGRRGFSAAIAGPSFSWAVSSLRERSVKKLRPQVVREGLCREGSQLRAKY